MSPAAESVIERLDATRQKWWFFSLLSTCVLAGCASFGLMQIFILGDAFLVFSQGIIQTLFCIWLCATAGLLWIVGRRLLRTQRGLEATARRVEAEFPEISNSLINLLHLAEKHSGGDPAFCQAAMGHAALQVKHVSFAAAAKGHTRWNRLRHCMQTPRDLAELLLLLGVLIGAALICEWYIPNWGSSVRRLLSPWEFVPSVGKVGLIEVTPKDTEILIGGSAEVVGRIENPLNTTYNAVIFIMPEGEAEFSLPLASDENHRQFKHTLSALQKALQYRLQIGDSQTPIYTIKVRPKPVASAVTVCYRFPAYLQRKDEIVKQNTADLEAPQFSTAQLQIQTSTPVAKGYIQIDGKQIIGRVEEQGRLLTVELPLIRNGSFTIHLFNEAGHTDPDPRINGIKVIADKTPTVELLKPATENSAIHGDVTPVTIRAGDDYGVGRVRLEMIVQDQEAEDAAEQRSAAEDTTGAGGAKNTPAGGSPPITVNQWTDFENSTAAVRHYNLRLDSEKYRVGQIVLLRAVAWDKRTVSNWGLDLKPQEAASGWHAVKIIAAEAKNSAALEQIESLRGAVWKILQKQIRARIAAAGILQTRQLSERKNKSTQVRGEQIEIQKATVAVIESAAQAEGKERQNIKRALTNLAYGDMLAAVRQGDEMLKMKTAEEFDKPVAELLGIQDLTIEVLRKLLDAARLAESEALAQMHNRPGGDLPDDAKQKLQDISDKLDKFLKEQKKIIEASENLAKMPVDDFTRQEEQLLKTLAAAEDDWAKFMKELHSDLSKLPEQDFANSTLLKEAVEIQNELKMAEDALLKKSVDIAVPLEQLGYEMAEEMKTNIEKWLPDTPDREKWSQEESLTDKDKEAPMAELPGELEDLVGELMEQEEDLFDEMEDVSSSAADSLDKGAGWDALDGPISNMSARGVTGNRLPNASEIGGRAGEGRQGKSSGEFVGEEAVGKGGRNTPSRLTADPYQKGQIKDRSKQPAGGATGGGKESGQGGEGLEGPVPHAPGPRDLQRLAEKQAILRNKAESVDVQLQVANYHHTDLEKMIDVMSQIEMDLKSGRYQNALRQRHLLAGGLGNVKQYLQGEFEVRRDTTANLPGEVQKEILGGMQDPSPSGWEELNRQYFENLSGGGKK